MTTTDGLWHQCPMCHRHVQCHWTLCDDCDAALLARSATPVEYVAYYVRTPGSAGKEHLTSPHAGQWTAVWSEVPAPWRARLAVTAAAARAGRSYRQRFRAVWEAQ